MKEVTIICITIAALVGIDVGVNIAIEKYRDPYYTTVTREQLANSKSNIDDRIDKLFYRIINDK